MSIVGPSVGTLIEGVYKPETVKAVLPPRVSRGEEFGLRVFTVPVLHRITYHWERFQRMVDADVNREGGDCPRHDVQPDLCALFVVRENMNLRQVFLLLVYLIACMT